MNQVILRTFTEEEYHDFFRKYVSDPLMDPTPFVYSREKVSRSYAYNHGGFRKDYVHLGIFLGEVPVGSFQLKRIDPEKSTCEFGIILQNDAVKNKGYGTEAILQGMAYAHSVCGIQTIFGDTMGRNKRMIRVFEKLGFRQIEIIPDAFKLADGEKEDRIIFCKDLTEVAK